MCKIYNAAKDCSNYVNQALLYPTTEIGKSGSRAGWSRLDGDNARTGECDDRREKTTTRHGSLQPTNQ